MRNLPVRRERSLPRWHEMVAEVTRDIDDLVDTFLQSLAALPAYRSGLVDSEELRDSAVRSLGLILAAVASDSTTTTLSPLPEELGGLRARQGIPVEQLVAAVRLDFRVVWSALLWRATSRDMTVLALHVEDLWAVVDDYARAVHQSYLQEKADMAANARDQQQVYLAELFGPSGQVPGTVEQVARALAVEPTGVFGVVVTQSEEAPKVHRAATLLASAEEKLFVLNQPGRVVVLWPANPRVERAEAQLHRLSTVAGGYVPDVAGLAAVPAAAGMAWDICRTIGEGDDGLRTLAQAWARVTKSRLDEQHPFSAALVRGLDHLAPAERALVVETVRTYLELGNVAGSAERLFCHRNTVLNRLGRFKKMTGLDVTVPDQAALALLALA